MKKNLKKINGLNKVLIYVMGGLIISGVILFAAFLALVPCVYAIIIPAIMISIGSTFFVVNVIKNYKNVKNNIKLIK